MPHNIRYNITRHKFYSLSDRTKMSRQVKTVEEHENLLSDFDRNNREYINKILAAISFISEYDVKYANNILEKIALNIETDPSFALRFMATDISNLNELFVTSKKNFLLKINDLTIESAKFENNSIEIFD